jgi:hypothetical protein
MLDELQREGGLYQDVAVGEILNRFGETFAYYNDNGNPAIAKVVLEEFRNLTNDSVVWSRSTRLWRPRDVADDSGRVQP